MKKIINAIRDSYPYKIYRNFQCLNSWQLYELQALESWKQSKFQAPSPLFIKQNCIIRNSINNAIWVETGTYLGQTTRILSKYATKVYSIEPEPDLYANAKNYFKTYKNVEIINNVSEKIFPILLQKLNGNINFWLDGHYSGDITFKGEKETSIEIELQSISKNINHFNKIAVLIDDVRLFKKDSNYPPLDILVDWARENKLNWHIEHDIFVAKN